MVRRRETEEESERERKKKLRDAAKQHVHDAVGPLSPPVEPALLRGEFCFLLRLAVSSGKPRSSRYLSVCGAR